METKVELPLGVPATETRLPRYLGLSWYDGGTVTQYGNRRAEEARQKERATRRDELALEAMKIFAGTGASCVLVDRIAELSYLLADAMLEARDRK